MKLKDVGFFQQHIEKLVLGIGALFLLIIAVLYLMPNPYSVEMRGRELGPGDVEAFINEEANRLAQELKEPLPEDVNLPEIPDWSGAILQRYESPLTENVRLTGISSPGPGDVIMPPADSNEPYYVPRPPMAKDFAATAGHGVLTDAPESMSQRHYQELVTLVGQERPRDYHYASVEARFDLDEWRNRLANKPEDAEGRQLRRIWWARMIGVAGVFLQRQERDPVSGEWTNTTIVKSLPIQIAFRPEDEQDDQWSEERGNQVVQYIREHQGYIQRTPFPPQPRHVSWTPPHDAPPKLSPEKQRQLRDVFEELTDTREKVRRWEERLNLSPGEPVEEEQLSPRQEAYFRQLQRERSELRKYIAERNEILGVRTSTDMPEGDDEGWRDEPSPGRAGPAGRRNGRGEVPAPYRDEPRAAPGVGGGRYNNDRARDPARREPERSGRRYLSGNFGDEPRPDETLDAADGEEPQRRDVVRVWAHDLTVEPGKTYRYRVIVTTLNPLFQQDRPPDAQKKQYYNQLALMPDEEDLAKAPWTDPVQIDPEYYFFLVGGSTENQTATVELWHVYNGRWRHGEFKISPGDPIAGPTTISGPDGETEVPMRTDAILVDLLSTSSGQGAGPTIGGGVRMLYLDPGSNQLADRTVAQDTDNPDRLRLQNETLRRQALAQREPEQPQP